MARHKKLRWTYDRESGERRSACGRYVVWMAADARSLEGGISWGALVNTPDGSGSDQAGETTWLTEHAGTVRDAKDLCDEHAKQAEEEG